MSDLVKVDGPIASDFKSQPREARMPNFEAGSFVVHAKLPDLGSGEILSNDKGTVRIRFASGERAFSVEKAQEHLAITQEAPAPPEKKAKKKKAAAKTAASKSVAP